MHTVRSRRFYLAVSTALLVAWFARPCAAIDIYVTTTADTNDSLCGGPPPQFPCSLRDAILVANARAGHDTIHVPAGTYNLTIIGSEEENALTGDLDIRDDVTIIGSGAGATVVDARGNDRVFQVHDSVGMTSFYNLTIRGGGAIIGAGISAQGGFVLIAGCNIEDNVSTGADTGGGGVTAQDATVSIFESSLHGNQATFGSAVLGGANSYVLLNRSTIYQNYCTNLLPSWTSGGAVVIGAGAEAEIMNSTIAQNENIASGDYPGGLLASGTVVVESSTFAENDGFEIAFEDYPENPGSITLRNTIISGECSGTGFHTAGGNLEGPGDTCQLVNPGDYSWVPIYLYDLGDHGGPTPTMPPIYVPGDGNLAIDNPWANAGCQATDQRGFDRPLDGNDDGVADCDSGAVELGFLFFDGFESGDTSMWSAAVP